MILQTPELTPSRKAATQEVLVPNLQNPENAVRSAMQNLSNPRDHESAVEQMRYQLYLLDRSQRRPSIEDYVSDLLDKPGPETSA